MPQKEPVLAIEKVQRKSSFFKVGTPVHQNEVVLDFAIVVKELEEVEIKNGN